MEYKDAVREKSHYQVIDEGDREPRKNLIIQFGIPFTLPDTIKLDLQSDEELSLDSINNYSDESTVTDRIFFKIREVEEDASGFLEVGIIVPPFSDSPIQVAREGKYYIFPNIAIPPEEDDELLQPTATLFDGQNTYFTNMEYLGSNYDNYRNTFSAIVWYNEENYPVQIGFSENEFSIPQLTLYKTDPRQYPNSPYSNLTFE